VSEIARTDGPLSPLSSREQLLLDQLEAEINSNLKGFKKVGYALTVIRDRALYRESHATFEEYCLDKWDIGRPHAYRLIESYEVMENLTLSIGKMSPMGDKPNPKNEELLPANERQARPLAKFSPEEQVNIWMTVIDVAHERGCRVTASLVQQCIDDILSGKVKKRLASVRTRVSGEETADMPEEIKSIAQSFIDIIQRQADNRWQEVGKRQLAEVIRELLKAIED